MQLRLFAALAILGFAGTACTAPIAEPAPELQVLHARAVTIHPTFTGDLANIAIPTIPAGASAKEVKKLQKKITAAKAKQSARVTLQNAALKSGQTVLNAADASLKLPSALSVTFTNDFHSSSSDSEKHVTFQFDAPVCAPSCVGHGYNGPRSSSPGKGQPGKIFNHAHATIFGENDV
ncbi:hypothetical protein NEOLEDRAFT_1241657 [Neolentinus lepideus HHB14362 ss-1]|uniref:Uncharacterized protein n=1 Tax=Neolentinus lepideus HHB14362 ss-1 TaxID=1314782 RepID=A0A165SPC5_9AGAM|nr:hypothetical protein NEOLEDRAFT_1241657 [Neolentinus lepideus HHB14362 ss-1]